MVKKEKIVGKSEKEEKGSSVEEKLELIKQVGEEIIGEEDLLELLKSGKTITAYDGFEPSGKIHIAQGTLRAINVNKLTKAGIKFKFWVADWFALMNNKLGGDLEKIRTVGKYFIEVWKACGMDMKNVEFLWASENMDQEYWLRVLKIGMNNSVARITRCAQIMGRSEKEELSAAQIFYPCMQASDIFQLNVDIAQLGMDQRKVNVLAREIASKLGYKKPIAIHHHMLAGLGKPPIGVEGAEAAIAKKMSKSNPDSAIFMTDTEEDIKRKINKAYCLEGDIKENPILEYCKYIIFEKFDKIEIKRPAKFGGDVSYDSYEKLEADFAEKKVHPMDLKNAVIGYLDKVVKPVREYFENNAEARALKKKVEGYTITR